MKAVILTRVSSKEQEDGKSLDAQRENLLRYCQRNNLEVLKTYTIVESSTRGDREDFYAMLDFCNKQKETIAVLVDAVDRLQRSFKESPLLDDLRKSGKIELHFIRENLKITQNTNSSEIMVWNIHVMLAQSYVLQLSENVKRSFDFKKKHGEWFGSAPIGYLNYKNEYGKSDIKVDEQRAPLIIKIFEKYAGGDISLLQLMDYAYKIGLRSKKGNNVSKANIVRIIDNRFYYGEMFIKNEIFPHNYSPIISRDLWIRCQEIRKGGKAKVTVASPIEHLFRGMITCKQSGRMVGVDRKKNRHGTEYNYLIYYDKTGRKRFYISEEIVINEVLKVLKSIKISDEDFEEAKRQILTTYDAEKGFYKENTKVLQKEITDIDKKLSNLLDLLIDNKIPSEAYNKKYEELKQKQQAALEQIERHQKGNYEFRENLTFFLVCKNRFYDDFCECSSVELKRQLLKFATRTLYINDGKVEILLRSPFDLMQKTVQTDGIFKWRE